MAGSRGGPANQASVPMKQCHAKGPDSDAHQAPAHRPLEHRTSNHPSIEPRTSNIEHPTSNNQPRTSNIQPSNHPIIQPSNHPIIQSSNHPTIQPSNHPTIQPSNHPTIQPSNHPTIQSSNHPIIQSSNHPTNPLLDLSPGGPGRKAARLNPVFPSLRSCALAVVLALPTHPAISGPYQGAGTKRMAERLEKIARESNPLNNLYLNRERAELFGRQLEQTLALPDSPDKGARVLELASKHATELLLAGSSWDAIEEFTR